MPELLSLLSCQQILSLEVLAALLKILEDILIGLGDRNQISNGLLHLKFFQNLYIHCVWEIDLKIRCIFDYLFPILTPNEILTRSTEIFIFGVWIFGQKKHKGMDWGITTKIRPHMWEQYFAVWIEPDIFFTAYAPAWYALIRRERAHWLLSLIVHYAV